MGSSGYLTCGICWECGNCYPRGARCPACGAAIDLDEDACGSCGEPIGEPQRMRARERFKAAKRAEAARDFPVAAVRPKRPSGPAGTFYARPL